MSQDYNSLYHESLDNPEGFWAEQAGAVDWDRPWDRVLDDSDAPFYRWFSGGQLNTCHNAVDRHVDAGRGEQDALVWDSPVTGQTRRYSYAELQDQVSRLAGVLRDLGVETGDRVIVYMPMVPEAAMAMLACARIGAIHSVVFGGFAGPELAKRIDDAEPRVILSASCGIEPSGMVDYKSLLDEALERSDHAVERCLILQREVHRCELDADRDLDWEAAMAEAAPAACVPVDANHPLYILYTSGTTGRPKGIVRDHGGHAVALLWTMRNIYGVAPGEVMFTASDVGWVVGHSYIVYGPLLNGSTTIIYEGKPIGTPDAGAFWRICETYGARALFTAPTALRAIKKEDPEGEFIRRYDLSKLRAFFLAGERSDPDSVRWADRHLGVPILDHWWQTETGWAIAGYPYGLEEMPVKIGTAGRPMPGYDVRVLDEEGEEMPRGELGNIVIRLPMPPGTMLTLWGNRERHRDGYLMRYPGHYLTGDSGVVDEDGYVHIMSRIDDVINVAGHRLSTGRLEEVLSDHPAVVEAAVFGVRDATKGQLPMGLVVPGSAFDGDDKALVAELVQRVREEVGPVAAFRQCVVVKRLPKTRSGKTLRGTMRSIANGEEWNMPATIDDPAVLDEIAGYLKR
ncbi:propionyl-CoA synthetase [Spiribacter onubensis]|uniref:Propionyl-CoA synthetase n=1 Tax=Spiribacter onubensis TaxID=3122420 RepID=A0ABV3S762_9GAMM